MFRAYEEIAEFITAGGGPEAVAGFQASVATRERVANLIEREKAGTIAVEERSELDQYMQLEHAMRLARAGTIAAFVIKSALSAMSGEFI